MEQRLTGIGGYLGKVDLGLVAQNIASKKLGEASVEAATGVVFLVEQGEQRGGLDTANTQGASCLDCLSPLVGLDNIVVGSSALGDELVVGGSIELGGRLGGGGSVGAGSSVGIGVGRACSQAKGGSCTCAKAKCLTPVKDDFF